MPRIATEDDMHREPNDETDLGEADRILAAAIYLMSCHARNGCPRLAYMVQRHFELIARHPGSGEQVRDTCKRLMAAWSAIGSHDVERASTEPAPASSYETLRRIVH